MTKAERIWERLPRTEGSALPAREIAQATGVDLEWVRKALRHWEARGAVRSKTAPFSQTRLYWRVARERPATGQPRLLVAEDRLVLRDGRALVIHSGGFELRAGREVLFRGDLATGEEPSPESTADGPFWQWAITRARREVEAARELFLQEAGGDEQLRRCMELLDSLDAELADIMDN